MGTRTMISAFRQWLAECQQRRDLAEFTCGHCTHNAQCGRAPSDQCVEKLVQISGSDDWRRRPAAHLGDRRIEW